MIIKELKNERAGNNDHSKIHSLSLIVVKFHHSNYIDKKAVIIYHCWHDLQQDRCKDLIRTPNKKYAIMKPLL